MASQPTDPTTSPVDDPIATPIDPEDSLPGDPSAPDIEPSEPMTDPDAHGAADEQATKFMRSI